MPSFNKASESKQEDIVEPVPSSSTIELVELAVSHDKVSQCSLFLLFYDTYIF